MGKAAGKKRSNAAKNEVVPKGATFMPGVGLKRLIKAHEMEKTGKSKYRLHAARLRKEGRGILEIWRIPCVAYSTVRDWLVRMRAGYLCTSSRHDPPAPEDQYGRALPATI